MPNFQWIYITTLADSRHNTILVRAFQMWLLSSNWCVRVWKCVWGRLFHTRVKEFLENKRKSSIVANVEWECVLLHLNVILTACTASIITIIMHCLKVRKLFNRHHLFRSCMLVRSLSIFQFYHNPDSQNLLHFMISAAAVATDTAAAASKFKTCTYYRIWFSMFLQHDNMLVLNIKIIM